MPEMLRTSFEALACHQVVLQDELFDDVVGHQLRAVHDGIAGYIWQTT